MKDASFLIKDGCSLWTIAESLLQCTGIPSITVFSPSVCKDTDLMSFFDCINQKKRTVGDETYSLVLLTKTLRKLSFICHPDKNNDHPTFSTSVTMALNNIKDELARLKNVTAHIDAQISTSLDDSSPSIPDGSDTLLTEVRVLRQDLNRAITNAHRIITPTEFDTLTSENVLQTSLHKMEHSTAVNTPLLEERVDLIKAQLSELLRTCRRAVREHPSFKARCQLHKDLFTSDGLYYNIKNKPLELKISIVKALDISRTHQREQIKSSYEVHRLAERLILMKTIITDLFSQLTKTIADSSRPGAPVLQVHFRTITEVLASTSKGAATSLTRLQTPEVHQDWDTWASAVKKDLENDKVDPTSKNSRKRVFQYAARLSDSTPSTCLELFLKLADSRFPGKGAFISSIALTVNPGTADGLRAKIIGATLATHTALTATDKVKPYPVIALDHMTGVFKIQKLMTGQLSDGRYLEFLSLGAMKRLMPRTDQR